MYTRHTDYLPDWTCENMFEFLKVHNVTVPMQVAYCTSITPFYRGDFTEVFTKVRKIDCSGACSWQMEGQVSSAPERFTDTQVLASSSSSQKRPGCQGLRSAAAYAAVPRLPEESSWTPTASVHGCGQVNQGRALAKDNTHHLLAAPLHSHAWKFKQLPYQTENIWKIQNSSLRGKH